MFFLFGIFRFPEALYPVLETLFQFRNVCRRKTSSYLWKHFVVRHVAGEDGGLTCRKELKVGSYVAS